MNLTWQYPIYLIMYSINNTYSQITFYPKSNLIILKDVIFQSSFKTVTNKNFLESCIVLEFLEDYLEGRRTFFWNWPPVFPAGEYRPTAHVQFQLPTRPVAFPIPSLTLPFQTTWVKWPIALWQDAGAGFRRHSSFNLPLS